MQSLHWRTSYSSFFRRLVDRVRAWSARLDRRATHVNIPPAYVGVVSFNATIHRDVTPNGVRVFSLCACCGTRLNASATLCDDCAAKNSRARQ